MTFDTTDTALQHCQSLVQQFDYDRYLSVLFAPEEKRPHLFGLYAFNLEISRIRERIQEPMSGEMRLQWWRDTLAAIYAGNVPDHPIAILLAGAIEEGNLTRAGFEKQIDARAFDLYDDPMPSLDALEGYLGETSSIVIQMAALVLAGNAASSAADAAGHAGVAYGLSGLMRVVPIHRARGQCYLPADVLARNDLKPSHILAGRMTPAVRMVMRELRHVAGSHLESARETSAGIPPAAMPAFLPSSLIELNLKRIARAHDPLNSVLEITRLRRQWRMLVSALFKDF